MFKLKFLLIIMLLAPLSACAGGFTYGVVTPAEVYRSLDDRPRVSILYTGNEADFVSVEDDGYPIVTGITAGQTVSFPIRISRLYGESRTFFMKGYRIIGSDTTFVGYRCRQMYFQGGVYGGGQSQPWVVDHLISASNRSGEGCN